MSAALPWPALRRRLLYWFQKNQRRYPWRRSGNWFHALMAEMMLRRTRADQALAVYRDFTKRYRTPRSALAAPPEELAAVLYPLGLDWRIRQLRETIGYVCDHYGARGPQPDDELTEIPGVGPYSRAILRNRWFGAREAAVDVNVARIFARLTGTRLHAESRRDRGIVASAQEFVNHPKANELNLALLDLAALVCRPARPHCTDCPLNTACAAAVNVATPRAARRKTS